MILLTLLHGLLIPFSFSLQQGRSFIGRSLRPRLSIPSFVHHHSRGKDPNSRSVTRRTILKGIAEWRDSDFGLPGSEVQIGVDAAIRGTPKSVCLLPFPFHDVLLQGETKQIRLYEERFIKLFRDVMDNYNGVVAMGLMAESGVIQTVPLCEVEAHNTMEGFGIFVSIVAVGRAQLLEVSQQEPYLKATCIEISDHIPPNLELPNLLAGNIENSMLTLSSMEHRLNEARENNDFEDKEMERKIKIAKMDGRFISEDDEDDDDDDDDTDGAINGDTSLRNEEEDDNEEEEDDDDEPALMDRLSRFRQAYEVALSTDTQGYRLSSPADEREASLSPRELTAISWASFCTELVPEDDATYRIQALDCDNLFDRLKLAFQMIGDKKAQLKTKLKKAGIEYRRNSTDEEGTTGGV